MFFYRCITRSQDSFFFFFFFFFFFSLSLSSLSSPSAALRPLSTHQLTSLGAPLSALRSLLSALFNALRSLTLKLTLSSLSVHCQFTVSSLSQLSLSSLLSSQLFFSAHCLLSALTFQLSLSTVSAHSELTHYPLSGLCSPLSAVRSPCFSPQHFNEAHCSQRGHRHQTLARVGHTTHTLRRLHAPFTTVSASLPASSLAQAQTRPCAGYAGLGQQIQPIGWW